jgi:hypothetical protein
MRYRAGSISLSPLEDDPVLSQVMQSRYISHEQLWKCICLGSGTTPRSTFNWRVSRLVTHGLLNRLNLPSAGLSAVYCVRRPGLEYLASRGECVPDFDWTLRRPRDVGLGAILHSLGLNDIYLRLKGTGIPFGWRWETEIRAWNELTGVPYAKDYDAVVSVYLDEREINFALEYERMAKSGSRYATIRKLIEAETHVRLFLYLAPQYNVLSFVRQHFENTRTRVYFGLLADFTESALDMKVIDSGFRSMQWRQVLLNGADRANVSMPGH